MDEEVVQEIERMRKEALLELCYVPLQKAEQNQLKKQGSKMQDHFTNILMK